jgi:DNA repair photolyase
VTHPFLFHQGELPMPDTRYQVQDIKTVLKKLPLADSFFISKYTCSPYRACEHACAYCDGRAEKYYVEGDFASDIHIRRNLPQQLANELSKLKEKGVVHFASGVSDIYQPVEAKEQLMRQCAQVMIKSGFPASVLTKSHLVQRDMDIWKMVHEQNGFFLLMTITFSNDEAAAIFEPGASSISQRLDTLQMFKQAGIPVGVMAMPLLPAISDTQSEMRKIVASLADIGVDFIVPGELTLRPGRQKDGFMHVLQTHYPQYVTLYQKLFAENRPSGRMTDNARNPFYKQFGQLLLEFDIPMFAPHALYHGFFQTYHELLILLQHLKYLYQMRGKDVRRLEKSTALYTTWLTARITQMNRSRKRFPAEIEAEIESLMLMNTWNSILQNQKLAEFTRQVIMEGKIFNYHTLQLE